MAKSSRSKKTRYDGRSRYTNRNGEEIIREGWGPDGNRIKTDPAFGSFLKQQTEFSNCIDACKLFRRTFLDFAKDAMDNRVTSRITKMMSNVKNLDPGTIGERTVNNGLKVAGSEKLIYGFNFNVKAKLDTVLWVKPEVNLQSNSVFFKNFKTGDDLNFPKGATHVCLDMAVAILNFKKKTSEIHISELEVINLQENFKSLKINIKQKPILKGLKVVVLRVGFLQELNGMQYIFSDTKKNVAEVVGIGK